MTKNPKHKLNIDQFRSGPKRRMPRNRRSSNLLLITLINKSNETN